MESVNKRYRPTYFYHLAHPTNFRSIRQNGLLSTERLIELTQLPENERQAILFQHRPESMVLANGVIIRDQKPMPPRLLARALPQGVPPSSWYRFLNRFVFLWTNRARVQRHLRAFGGGEQILLTFDAQRLLTQLGDRIYFSPITAETLAVGRLPAQRCFLFPIGNGSRTGGGRWPVTSARDHSGRQRFCWRGV
jgi:hypothetical protein